MRSAAAFANSDANLSQMSPILQQAHQTGKAENPQLKDVKANYVTFLSELKKALPSGTFLSIKSAAIANILDPGFDLAGIAAAVDFINVMCYDYYGAWSQSTGPISALYKEGSAEPSDQLNCNWTIAYHLSKMHNPGKTSYANLTSLGGIMICAKLFIGITYKLVCCYLKFRLVLPSSAILGNYWNMYPVNGTNNDSHCLKTYKFIPVNPLKWY
uniref:GH18 domain-containing protein n=1 Tax=Globodera rostochiensis TaxID=31243 RepID=A0A914H580_GLORO